MIGQRAQLGIARTLSRGPGLVPQDDGLIVQPLFHLAAKFLQLAHHFCGAGIHLHGSFEPAAVWDALTRERITVTAQALIAHCRSRIASYKKPKRIEFVEALPRLGTGKVDNVTLRAPFWRGHARQVV